ncbi:MAG: hypothetical protein A2Z75_06500 [Chloroflexi bacterium RBG_13_50_10]|nr:MAG: hypothetical protein A2Z75_06500 [Chloroflexi bacterium RBG_13_50_10]
MSDVRTIDVSSKVRLKIERCPIIEDDAKYSTRMIERKKWLKWREEVFKKDDYKCQICGSTKDPIPHHKKPFVSNLKERYDPKNGITLCRKCHGKSGERQYALGILSPRNPPNAIQLPMEIKIGRVTGTTKLRKDKFGRVKTSLMPKGDIYPLFYFYAILSDDIVWVWNEAEPSSFVIGIPGIFIPAEASDEELLQLIYPHFKESYESISNLQEYRKGKKECAHTDSKELHYLFPLFNSLMNKNGK